MKICYIVDARSPIARNWINYFIGREHQVHVISSYPCSSMAGATTYQAPVALSSFSGASRDKKAKDKIPASSPSTLARLQTGVLGKLSFAAQHVILPFDVYRHVERVKGLVDKISPDLVHAMRIPFEGILAAKATPPTVPLLISVWGNDFTFWAARNPLIAPQTRKALARADALHCDCRRDLTLASDAWGFDPAKLATVLPGAGGIQLSLFHPGEPDSSLRAELNIPDEAPVIINPRGFRSYVRNDVFFRAIPDVLRVYPKAIFVCTGMRANPIAERWADELGVKNNVRLLPLVQRDRMADLFRTACVAVSPSLHDGTPNTLLEAMACGCFPVAGDIESVREWITDGLNGLLCDPTDSDSLARAIIRALEGERLRVEAREENLRLIGERAEYGEVMRRAEDFYAQLVRQK